MRLSEIHELAERALEINRTFEDGVWPKQAMKPEGWMPPGKRQKIIEILEEIANRSKVI